jgi:hypothetical protein
MFRPTMRNKFWSQKEDANKLAFLISTMLQNPLNPYAVEIDPFRLARQPAP